MDYVTHIIEYPNGKHYYACSECAKCAADIAEEAELIVSLLGWDERAFAMFCEINTSRCLHPELSPEEFDRLVNEYIPGHSNKVSN